MAWWWHVGVKWQACLRALHVAVSWRQVCLRLRAFARARGMVKLVGSQARNKFRFKRLNNLRFRGLNSLRSRSVII